MIVEGDDVTRIFKYTVAGRDYFGDPLAIASRLNRALLDEDADVLFKNLADKDDALFGDAAMRVAPAACEAFRLPPLLDEDTGEGTPALQAVDVLFNYFMFMDELKKNGGSPPSGSPTSGGPSPGGPREPGELREGDLLPADLLPAEASTGSEETDWGGSPTGPSSASG